MAEPAAAPRPDTDDMYAVHGVFRDSLGAAPTLVGGIAPGDAERAALIANYYENVLSFLEAHHDGEEQLVFPLLRERCTGAAALVDPWPSSTRRRSSCWRRPERRWRPGPAGDAAAQEAAAQERSRRSARASGGASRRGGAERASPGGGEPLRGGVGRPAGPRHGPLRRRQDLADPRPDQGAHDRRAAGRHARSTCRRRRSRCGPASASRPSRTTRRWSRWRSSTTPE